MRRERPAMTTRLLVLVALASFLAAAAEPMLATGGVRDVTPRRCAPEGYGFSQAVLWPAGGRSKAVRLSVGWLTAMEKRRPCFLHTTIRLTVSDASRDVLHTSWTMTSVRRPWSGIVHTWAWRNWCETEPQGAARVTISAPGEGHFSQKIEHPPACETPGAPSTLTDLGTGTKYAHRSDRLPPHILRKGIPSPIHWALVNPRNAWLVSDGYTLVAVYAGNPGGHPSLGRFVIVHQNETFGAQYVPDDIVDVGRVGAIKIVHPPRGRSRETTAQYGHLPFVSTNGTRGFLDLTNDRVRVTYRPKPRDG